MIVGLPDLLPLQRWRIRQAGDQRWLRDLAEALGDALTGVLAGVFLAAVFVGDLAGVVLDVLPGAFVDVELVELVEDLTFVGGAG